ncbi:MAG: ABC transporter permease [Myxococcota bacterium]
MTRLSPWGRRESMLRLGISMMFHDRSKLLGTSLGVIFATVLMIQQVGTLFGLLYKNTQFVDNAAADIWIVPPATQQALPGSAIPFSVLPRTRVTEGVDWAEPLLMGGAAMMRPDGGREGLTLVGTTLPRLAGGPWAMVAGEAKSIATADTVIVDDGQRAALGGVNLGSIRELSGRKVTIEGFTWGLIPFGPGYAFAGYETARSILRLPSDQTSFVLVGVKPNGSPEAVAAELRRVLGPEVEVYTKQGFHDAIVSYLLGAQIGITFGTSTAFALIVGFVIVSLSMFSAVVDNVREFGVLKAMGATNLDLTVLLLGQASIYAVTGTTIGLFLATLMAEGIRSANLVLVLPSELLFGAYGLMAVLCAAASMLAIFRVRNIEPGMVFR